MKFLTRSLIILLLLYGLLFAIGDLYMARNGVPLWGAIIFAVIFIGLQYLLSPHVIEWTLAIHWDEFKSELPVKNWEFIEKLCADRGLKVPRIGVIHSGTPNAFCFGRVPGDARLVVTTGLLEVLTPEETNAVLAHEIGHIEHWDFVVMTIAALVPLLLYQIYAFADRINNSRAVGYAAYACYLLSQFMVLLLNRSREYFADHYSAEVTHAPDQLSSALVKIAYGVVRADGEYKKALQDKDTKSEARRNRRLAGSMAVMGISNLHSGAALALAGADPASASSVMRWDLVNPWARFYELNSTHPLTALRVRALNEQAETMHQVAKYPLPSDNRIRWGTFPLELVIWATPWVSIVLLGIVFWAPELITYFGLTIPEHMKPILLIIAGATGILRTWYRYHGEFQPATVGTLIEDVEVSQMRPRAVQLKGQIVGRGVPGAFWSSDLVLRDSTGILFVLYRQSIPLARLMFAITEAESYIGQEVEIEGWFRRGLSPYVEMSLLKGENGESHRAYSRWIQYGLGVLAIIAGYYWLQM